MAQTRNWFMQCTFVYLLITLISLPSRVACRKQDNAVFYRCNLLETAALTGISASTGHQIRVLFPYDCLSTWLQSETYFWTKKRAEAHRHIIHFLGLMSYKVTLVYLLKFVTLLSSWNPSFHKGALCYICIIGIFHWHNPSGRNMALGLTQPLKETSTRNISCGVKAADA